MSRRILLFCTLAVLAAGLFVRLGFWQLSRLRERQAFNALMTRQQRTRPIPFAELPRDTAGAHYRGASVRGRFDYDHELLLANRTRRGSPGAEFLTPLRVPGSDTAVLVNRGWVYSPDGSTVDRSRWREGEESSIAGYVEVFARDSQSARSAHRGLIRRASRAEIAPRVPYPLAPYYLVAVGDTADLTHPARRDLPVLDDGPHRGYALQWFSFAVIALGGAGIVATRERERRRTNT
ncbi:MAG: SURF1 family protein [Gemmatimonadaceae bacterium]